jgi:hypothetical protein
MWAIIVSLNKPQINKFLMAYSSFLHVTFKGTTDLFRYFVTDAHIAPNRISPKKSWASFFQPTITYPILRQIIYYAL